MGVSRPAAALVAGLLALSAPPAQAQAQAPEARPVHLRVRVVHAAERPGEIDPQLRDIPRALGPMKFGTLRLIEQRQLQLGVGQAGHVPLPDRRELTMTPVAVEQRNMQMRLQMPGQVNSQLNMTPGRPVVLGGPRHEDGHVIVYIEPEF
jgi:hypothetical protein